MAVTPPFAPPCTTVFCCPTSFAAMAIAPTLPTSRIWPRAACTNNAGQVWSGLAKNATEGMAAPARILPFTFLLFCGQILPLCLAVSLALSPAMYSSPVRALILVALAASFLPRLLSVWKYRQPLLSALLHPLGVALLLTLQWYALLRKFAGQQVTWKERAYRVG